PLYYAPLVVCVMQCSYPITLADVSFFFLCGLLFTFIFFFFNDTATTEIYTLSLHDALPIWVPETGDFLTRAGRRHDRVRAARPRDRKSTRLNSSHRTISYAVFCLKKKKKKKQKTTEPQKKMTKRTTKHNT